MINSNESKKSSEHFATPLKAAVWFAVVGFVVLAVETPHWSMSSDKQSVAAPTPPAVSSAPATDYFPARFPAPTGEPEAVPATF